MYPSYLIRELASGSITLSSRLVFPTELSIATSPVLMPAEYSRSRPHFGCSFF